MFSLKSALILPLLFSVGVHCCQKQNNGLKKSDCKKFPKMSAGCKRVYLGKRQSEDLALSIYRNVARGEDVDQENMLLVPVELSRVISALVHGTETQKQEKNNSVDQMRCYVSSATKRMHKSLLVSGDDQPKQVRKKEKDALMEKNSTVSPKMLYIDRHIFVDQSLKASENYSKEVFCWYEMEISGVDFKSGGADAVNKWSEEKSARALEVISNITKDDAAKDIRKPLAGDPKNIAHALAVVTSSMFLKMTWRKGLFRKEDTRKAEPFYIKMRGDGDHENSETNVKIPMLSAVGKFNFVNTSTYEAVALPLHQGLKDSYVIVVVPKKDVNLSSVEEEVFGSGTVFKGILETLGSANETKLKVLLPKLTIQITHEWGTPRNKSIKRIVSDTGKALGGASMGIYQDTFLELIEGSSDKDSAIFDEDNSTAINKEGDDKQNGTDEFRVDRNFLFVMMAEHDIIAIGRIKDPYWCKFCSSKHGGGNHTEKAGASMEKDKEADGAKKGSKSILQRVQDFFG